MRGFLKKPLRVLYKTITIKESEGKASEKN